MKLKRNSFKTVSKLWFCFSFISLCGQFKDEDCGRQSLTSNDELRRLVSC